MDIRFKEMQMKTIDIHSDILFFLQQKKTFKEAFLSSKLFCSQDFIERKNNGNGITTITTTRIHKKKIKSTNPNFIQLLILVNKYIF